MFFYIDNSSFIHRLDPRTKILVLLVNFALPLLFYSIPVLMALAAITLGYGFSGRVLSNLPRIRVVLLMITFFTIAIWSLTGEGERWFWGFFSTEGFIYGVATAIKLNTMIAGGMIFLSSTKLEDITGGLVKLRVPYRAAFAFSTALRLVPTVMGRVHVITMAQKSRGLKFSTGGILTRTRKHIPLLIPAFVSVIRDVDLFSMALESKGFGYSSRRSNYREYRLGKIDYLTIACLILLVLAAGLLKCLL